MIWFVVKNTATPQERAGWSDNSFASNSAKVKSDEKPVPTPAMDQCAAWGGGWSGPANPTVVHRTQSSEPTSAVGRYGKLFASGAAATVGDLAGKHERTQF